MFERLLKKWSDRAEALESRDCFLEQEAIDECATELREFDPWVPIVEGEAPDLPKTNVGLSPWVLLEFAQGAPETGYYDFVYREWILNTNRRPTHYMPITGPKRVGQ